MASRIKRVHVPRQRSPTTGFGTKALRNISKDYLGGRNIVKKKREKP